MEHTTFRVTEGIRTGGDNRDNLNQLLFYR